MSDLDDFIEDLVVPFAVGAVAGIVAAAVGATTMTAMAVGAVAGLLTAADSELWNEINKHLANFRDRVLNWLNKNQSFGAKVVKFSVKVMDKVRGRVNYILKAEAVNQSSDTVVIGEEVLTPEQVAEMGINDGMTDEIIL